MASGVCRGEDESASVTHRSRQGRHETIVAAPPWQVMYSIGCLLGIMDVPQKWRR